MTRQSGAVRRIATMAGTQMRTEMVVVSPEQAKVWLEKNTDSNREISGRTVEAYAEDMAAGRWRLTHQGIAFNPTGELVDGQHRMHAVIKSGKTVPMMVTTGLSVEYNSPIDQGYNRSISHLTGRSSRWVSIVRGLMAMEGGFTPAAFSFKNTVGAAEACAKNHAEAIEVVMGVSKSSRTSPTGVVAALVYAYPVAQDKVLSFAAQIETGELLERGDPALHLRKWIALGRHTSRETIIATLGTARSVLQNKPHTAITAGIRTGEGGRDGSFAFVWFTQRRRALKVPGTPSVQLVPGSGKQVEE